MNMREYYNTNLLSRMMRAIYLKNSYRFKNIKHKIEGKTREWRATFELVYFSYFGSQSLASAGLRFTANSAVLANALQSTPFLSERRFVNLESL